MVFLCGGSHVTRKVLPVPHFEELSSHFLICHIPLSGLLDFLLLKNV